MSNSFYKIKKGITLSPQSSDPIDASAGDIYFNSGSNKFRTFNGTTWSDIPSAASEGDFKADGTVPMTGNINLDGHKVINSVAPTNDTDLTTKIYVDQNDIVGFIKDGNAEYGVTNYIRYANTPDTMPINGTGGSPSSSVIWTTGSTDPLSGTESFLLIKDSSNRQGEGVSRDFTIDIANKAKVQKIEFDYIVDAGTFDAAPINAPGTPSDLVVYIYDVDNGTLIQPSSYRLFSNSMSTPDRFTGYFQTSSNSTNYRLIFHIATSTTNGWVLKVDNITVSPSEYVYGTPVTDWVPVTVTGSWTTNTTYAAMKRRIGGDVEYQVRVTLSGAPNNTFLDLISVLADDPIDTSKILLGLQNSTQLGYGVARDNGVGSWPMSVEYLNNTLAVRALSPNGTTVWSANLSQTIPFTFANTDTVTVNFKYPRLGWSSAVQMSDNASLRIVDFIGSNTGSDQSLTGSVTPIAFTVTKDSHSAWTGNSYVVPTSGDYLISLALRLTTTSSLFVYINGVSYKAIASVLNTSYHGTGSLIVPNLKAGDVITIRCSGNTTVTNNANNDLSISRIAGPSTIAATETISARYTSISGQTIGTSNTLLNFATRDYDTHGAYTSGIFTCPTAGKYEVICKISSLFILATNQGIVFDLYKNGSYFCELNTVLGNNGTAPNGYRLQGIGKIQCNSGDTLSIYARSTVSTTLVTTAGVNWITFDKLGN